MKTERAPREIRYIMEVFIKPLVGVGSGVEGFGVKARI